MNISEYKTGVRKIADQHDRGLITPSELIDKIWEMTIVMRTTAPELIDPIAAIESLAMDPTDSDLWDNACDLMPAKMYDAVRTLYLRGKMD